MQKILSISEAFAQNPEFLRVAEKEPRGEARAIRIKWISEEVLTDAAGEKQAYYVCYNWNDEPISQYVAKSMNVDFFIK